MADKAHLYFLVSEDHDKFKVGITTDIDSRITVLSKDWGAFDLDASVLFSGDYLEITKLESFLHFIFSRYNLDVDKCLVGHTEWFSMGCFDDALAEVSRISEAKGGAFVAERGIKSATVKETQRDALSGFLFNEYRYRVLSFLLSGGVSHVRGIGRATGLPPGSLHRELSAMSDLGIALKEKRGNALVYQANQDHPVYPELKALLEKTFTV